MDLYRSIKKSTFPRSAELLLELMVSEGVKKLRPGSLEGLVENCILRPCQQSSLQRFQVTTMLLNFYSNKHNYKAHNEVFLSIFTAPSSRGLLHNLLSSSIHLRNNNLLDSAALWMMTTDLKSGVVLALVRKLLEEGTLHSTITQSILNSTPSSLTCPLNPLTTPLINSSNAPSTATTHLPTLPPTLSISCSFIRNCIIVITLLYPNNYSDRHTESYVSRSTVELICDWLQLDPPVCHPSMLHYNNNNLNNNKNHNNNNNNNNSNSNSNNNTNNNNNNALVVLMGWVVQAGIHSATSSETTSLHWHRLHYLILQSLSVNTPSLPPIDPSLPPTTQPSSTHTQPTTTQPSNTITTQASTTQPTTTQPSTTHASTTTPFIHLQQLLPIFQAVTSAIDKLPVHSDLPSHLDVLLEQICQFVQVALSSAAILLSQKELARLLHKCPNTRLVQMIRKKHNF